MRFWKLFRRAMMLRCPVCGIGGLFKGLLAMHDSCSHCGTKFEREPGFFLGSIYINYGLTALITAIAYPVLLFGGYVKEQPLLWSMLVFVVIFPLFLHRHARSLWLGFDQWHDPREGETGVGGTVTASANSEKPAV
ncbi:hypothetical protein Psta_2919 [Pirellula staleyi DSM 6068]|uniref:DUF983 domain-containing protein n=1 Tax=Pirellula staleyi (strain ATCC 27377 / DSM 6068 / ICPB 4128) TaxID=530564 RepID=D2R8P3_PIRSD|nr:DUF983 domain-containing protein [Pirellula staleyi]ADB17584.1 hypothetical protein Psta_2919 [Pirellula staleyi DSM 6068]